MATSKYLDFLSKFGVGGAHPGGLKLTKQILLSEKINNSSTVFDVGCGTGQTAAYLSSQFGAKVIGMDINPVMVKKAKKRIAGHKLPVEIIVGSIEDCPLRDETFDFIISESVLAFVNKPKALHEIFRLLKDGGRFIANELTINSDLSLANREEIKQFYGLDSVLMEQDWVSLLKQSGFSNIKMRKEKPSLLKNNAAQEFHYSTYIEPELFSVMNQHHYILAKYQGIIDYRIFTCSK
ncbi:class I SAM-dependent methyltransferase [Bacillus sp. S/N-304-OC-R1]|uniref:class I SAM-dependent methyltransferase n=1 Tax=Bacillus sp. S/N-304-OC-R1 TaxID=2758034 RepID=UPI001C8D3ACF|nr:class I SAM-dependent methyltransferase [Bacillus sp. S/N-304-OC-R1]MBY0121791.1 class I SAM-dependent methyltransferase [Bacillus sp. S/N-304-OC-R1]